MNHSTTKASDILNDIFVMNEEIQSTILIGEKIAKIYEAGRIYNHIKSLITPEYLSDDEFEFLKDIAKGWNEEMTKYAKSQNGDAELQEDEDGDGEYNPLEEIEEQIRQALDDLMDGFSQDSGGFDGGDGIY